MTQNPTMKQAILNGLRLRCPHCGKGKLFQSYLKQQDACPHCHENLKRYRADDGPAWLTILITGHIIVPLMVVVTQHDYLSYWVELGLAFGLTTVLALSLLPLAKGLFIAILWKNARKKMQAKDVAA